MEDILIEFQIYLNDRKLNNNHDWDFEKEAKNLLSEYADYDLGLKIADAVETDGQCEFTAEL